MAVFCKRPGWVNTNEKSGMYWYGFYGLDIPVPNHTTKHFWAREGGKKWKERGETFKQAKAIYWHGKKNDKHKFFNQSVLLLLDNNK